MKKILSIILSFAMACSMCVCSSLTAFAATEKYTVAGVVPINFEINPEIIPAEDNTITTVGGSKSTDVKGTYVTGSVANTVYSVDVAWDSMEFTYTAGSAGTWNPETHTYRGGTTGTWSETNNTVTVTNHSNAAVDARLSYNAADAIYTAITGTFIEDSGTANDNKLEIETAEGTLPASAPTATATLKLSGELSGGVNSQKIGTVTVTITEHFAVDGGEGELD